MEDLIKMIFVEKLQRKYRIFVCR